MSKTYDIEFDFYLGGIRVGGSCVSAVDGKIDTQAVEDEFYAVLRKNEKKILESAEEYEREYIIDHLTSGEEEKLKEAHAKDYHGTDDDMPDAYEDWLMGLSLKELKEILV